MPNDAYMSAGESYTSRGYKFETHKITTDDGYILTAWRVPGLLNETAGNLKTRKPVFLQHGLIDCSGTWLITDSENQLVKYLVDEGYDVWMGNNRGTQTSFEHINPKKYSVFFWSSPYWAFSFDEMA